MRNIIKIGMADMNICEAPDGLTTIGLGSCVGTVLYDPKKKIAGMVHVMLPDSTAIKNNSNRAKFADTGIETLLDILLEKGVQKSNLIAKIAGGAQMFSFSGDNEMLRIGDRNIEATKKKLSQLGIKLVSDDTGDNYGRTIIFDPETGELIVKSIGRGNKVI